MQLQFSNTPPKLPNTTPKFPNTTPSFRIPVSEYHVPVSEYDCLVSECHCPVSEYHFPVSEYHFQFPNPSLRIPPPVSEYHSPVSEYTTVTFSLQGAFLPGREGKLQPPPNKAETLAIFLRIFVFSHDLSLPSSGFPRYRDGGFTPCNSEHVSRSWMVGDGGA